jgi:CRISPR-associated exonuclease Cas4
MDLLDPVPLSALQHWAYCPRQCALIHLEQAFDDNMQTQRGQAVHALVDTPTVELRAGLRTERALPLWHDEIGLIGKADVVEFEPDGTPYPVEYKHGSRHKAADIAACDDLQLAAQAVCLEAQTGYRVPEGAIFYASSKRRRVVLISEPLRQLVAQTADAVRSMLATGVMPPPTQDARRCRGCSLRERCQPEALRALAAGPAAGDDLFVCSDEPTGKRT